MVLALFPQRVGKAASQLCLGGLLRSPAKFVWLAKLIPMR